MLLPRASISACGIASRMRRRRSSISRFSASISSGVMSRSLIWVWVGAPSHMPRHLPTSSIARNAAFRSGWACSSTGSSPSSPGMTTLWPIARRKAMSIRSAT